MTTPKQLISGRITARSGKEAKGANCLSLLLKHSEGRGQLGRFVFIGEHASWDPSPISS